MNWEKLNFEESTINIFTSKLFWDEGRLLAVYLSRPDSAYASEWGYPDNLYKEKGMIGGKLAYLFEFLFLNVLYYELPNLLDL